MASPDPQAPQSSPRPLPEGAHVRPAPPDRKASELTGDLARQMADLVHHEIELAKAELSEKGKRAGIGTGLFGAAAIAGLLGVACLTAFVIALLHLALPVWLSILIVAIIYLFVAGACAMVGRREVREAAPPVPSEAIESTKEDVAWLKTQARSARQ
jgi:uncharacterized membrane protein YqjE